jgi:hypothetical protein
MNRIRHKACKHCAHVFCIEERTPSDLLDCSEGHWEAPLSESILNRNRGGMDTGKAKTCVDFCFAGLPATDYPEGYHGVIER